MTVYVKLDENSSVFFENILGSQIHNDNEFIQLLRPYCLRLTGVL